MDLGNRLYEFRKQKKISQEEAAEKLNVTRQTISKWETDQSTPDFDKIMPICELYAITPQELVTGEKVQEEETSDSKYSYFQSYEEENNSQEDEQALHSYRKKHAVIVAVSVFLYIISVAVLIAFTTIAKKPIAGIILFFVVIAIATMMIVFSSMSKPKNLSNNVKFSKETKLYKQITSILSGVYLIMYMVISFLTGAWHITWIIWIIYGVVCEIIKLIFSLKGAEINEE